ncbi:MAG: hypothetical protein IPH63_10460 [Flavobacteriales bacterium]|nr:hypothetical protein [Flavobacteriales bacterium]
MLYRNLTWFGEVATSANGGKAMNTGLLMSLDKRVSMSLLYRNYGRNYQAQFARSFGETIDPWNGERAVHRHRIVRADNGPSMPTSISSASRGCATSPMHPPPVSIGSHN